MQDIYYHRPRGLSTVFAKKFEIFFAKQKKVLLPPSGGGRRALFSAADSSPAPPCARGYPCALCGALCALRCPVRPGVPRAPWDALCALECPCVACGAPCALCGAPVRPGVSLCALGLPLCALRCPMRSGVPHALWGAPCPLWGCPVCSSVFSVRPCSALRASVSLAAHHALAIQSAPLPCLAATLSPAQRRSSPPPRRTAEKKPGRSKRSGRALFISLSGDEAQVSDQALGLPNWQSLLPESEVHISSMFRGSL